MNNWYSREFISSSQTAARLVFNINNCVDLSRVLHSRPNRPPDSSGRESYVYCMDGAVCRSIKDLPVDELTPWNSKKCKSSTRFSSVQFDGQKNSLVFSRYIISDATQAEKPECLLACYYCKHPIFNLVKKIYYACSAERERCLPGTFVIFIYEFAQEERLHRTYGTVRHHPTSINNSADFCQESPPMDSPCSSTQPPILPTGGGSSLIPQRQSFVQPLKLMETGLKMEDFLVDDGEGSGFGLDGLFQQDCDENPMQNMSCLEDILQSCTEVANSLKRVNNNNNNGSTEIAFKRIRRQIEEGEEEHRCSRNSPASSNNNEFSSNRRGQFRHFFTTKALIENFCHNCLCDADTLTKLLDKMDEQFVEKEEQEDETNVEEQLLGGCLLVDSPIPIGDNLSVCVLWFRNPVFLDADAQPVVQPVAALLATETLRDDTQFMLNELSKELGGESKSICRSVIENCVDQESSQSSLCSPLLSYPCTRIVPCDQLRALLRQKMDGEEEALAQVERDLFTADAAVLNSLSFEDFVHKLRAVEKGWPSGFRTWFREKNGWIFGRCSLGSRLKAGFTSATAEEFSAWRALAPLKELILHHFSAAIEENGNLGLDLDEAVSTMEQICTDLLFKSVKAVIDPTSEIKLHPAKAHLCLDRQKWVQISASERRERLSILGFASLDVAGTLLSADLLDPLLFAGLSRAQKMELISRANSLDLVELSDSVEKQRYIVEDGSARKAFFIGSGAEVYCQCWDDRNQQLLCEHIIAAVLKYPTFAKKVSEKMTSLRKNVKTEVSDSGTTPVFNGLQLDNAPIVEVIYCAPQGENSSPL